MTNPLTPEGIEDLALTYAQEYRLPGDRVKLLIEACERFDPSHKTLAVALALLSQRVTITTTVKPVI
jgi:hypothetical protein